MKLSMVCVDLDGTFLTDLHESISPHAALCMEELENAGVLLVPTTGRTLSRIPAAIRALPHLRYAITSNGSQVFDVENNTLIWGRYLDPEALYAVVKLAKEKDFLLSICSGSEMYVERRWLEYYREEMQSPDFQSQYLRISKGVDTLEELLPQIEQKVFKVIVSQLPPGEVPGLVKEFARIPNTCPTRGLPTNIEIVHGGVNKLAGIRALCQYLGCSLEEVLSFGDGDNDMDMLRGTGYSYAPASATEGARKAARAIAPAHTEDGIVKTIRALLDSRRLPDGSELVLHGNLNTACLPERRMTSDANCI